MARVELKHLHGKFVHFHRNTISAPFTGWIFETIVHYAFTDGGELSLGSIPQPIPMPSDNKDPPTFTELVSTSSTRCTTAAHYHQSAHLSMPLHSESRSCQMVTFCKNAVSTEVMLGPLAYYIPANPTNPLSTHPSSVMMKIKNLHNLVIPGYSHWGQQVISPLTKC